MHCKAPDKRFYRELTDLNAEFLALITWEGHAPGLPFLGLAPAIRAQLMFLDRSQQEFIAATPTLLAGFAQLPTAHGVNESPPSRPGIDIDTEWRRRGQIFSAGLMTYLWQLAQRDALNAALCIGASQAHVRKFAELNFRDIQARTELVTGKLEARFCRHPRFWPDLIRVTQKGTGVIPRMSRLASIPLAVAEQRLETVRPKNQPAQHW
jgi:hypothetical protein